MFRPKTQSHDKSPISYQQERAKLRRMALQELLLEGMIAVLVVGLLLIFL